MYFLESKECDRNMLAETRKELQFTHQGCRTVTQSSTSIIHSHDQKLTWTYECGGDFDILIVYFNNCTAYIFMTLKLGCRRLNLFIIYLFL